MLLASSEIQIEKLLFKPVKKSKEKISTVLITRRQNSFLSVKDKSKGVYYIWGKSE